MSALRLAGLCPRPLIGISLYMSLSWLALAPLAFADPLADLDDAQARAEYAYYTADIRALESIVQVIERLEVPASLATLQTHDAAYGRWKLAELYTASPNREGKRSARTLAVESAQACLSHAKRALSLDAKMAEAQVLDSVCTAVARTPHSGDLLSSIPLCARSKSFRAALELAPTNPRVMLMEGQCLYGNGSASSADAIDRLRAVVAAFDAAPPSPAGHPQWGQAEALLLLGKNYLRRGDAHAARDVIEKALVIAPDYRQARELLDTAAVRPR